MKLVSPETRVLVGMYCFGIGSYLALFTDKDYGVWLATGAGLVTAGIVKSFSNNGDVSERQR